MFKKQRLWKPFKSRHSKRSETRPKSVWQQFYHILKSLWQRLSSKISLLVIFEILGLFVNTLTANDMDLWIVRIYWNQFKCDYLRNNFFSDFFAAVCQFSLNFNTLKIKMTLIAHAFPKLRTSKDVVR